MSTTVTHANALSTTAREQREGGMRARASQQAILALLLAIAAVLTALVLIPAQPAFADGEIGTGVDWSISNGVLTIEPSTQGETGTLPNSSGLGKDATATQKAAIWPWFDPNLVGSIKSVTIKDGVIAPAGQLRHMLSGMSALEKADLSGLQMADVGVFNDVFKGSTALTEVILPQSFAPQQMYRTFSGCSALTTIQIGTAEKPYNPQLAKDRSDNKNAFKPGDIATAFTGCSSLTTLKMPNANLSVSNDNWTNRVNNLVDAFNGNSAASTLPKTIEMPGAQINAWLTARLFQKSTLAELYLQGATLKKNSLYEMFHKNGDAPMLEKVDMTGIKFVAESDTATTNAWGLFRNFPTPTQSLPAPTKSLPALKEVILTNANFGNTQRFHQMFMNCEALETVKMNSDANAIGTSLNVSEAVRMDQMFQGCVSLASLDVSGFGKMERIVNMNNFVNGCAALTTLNISYMDNSRIKPTRNSHPASGAPDNDPGAIACDVDWGRMLALHTCTSLATIDARNSNVWIVENTKGTPSKEYFLAENNEAVYNFTEKQFTFTSDVTQTDPVSGGAVPITVSIETKRDYVDLVTDRHETATRGIDNHPESNTNKNMTGGSHLNTNGAGHLAPGVYTIGANDRGDSSPEAKLTYYRITEMGKDATTRTVEIVNNLGGVIVPDGAYGVATIQQSRDFWGTEKVLGDGNSALIRVTYKGAATDINGDKHDVVVEVKKITFKDGNLIPNSSAYDQSRRSHDTNKVAGDSYSRKILQAEADRLKLNNYVYATGWSNGSTTGTSNERVLSQGSGTYIDFDIKVKDAVDGSSVLFYVDDLDVPHQQSWQLDTKDACYDVLTWENVEYGEGSEGMVLGTGNDIDTLSFADHTGLQLLNRNYVVSTGSDPSTSWSEFYVRANANQSSYTWTSGIGCDTDLLKNTAPVPQPNPVWVMPEAIKHVNNTVPVDTYADKFFDFTFSAANQSGANYTYNGVARNVASLDNLATTTTEQDLKNTNEHVTVKELKFEVPDSNDPEKYVYQIVEKDGSHGDIISYDTDTTHYMQVVVFRPTNDLEMYQGTRAEIILGTKFAGSSAVSWKTDEVYVVYATNAQLVPAKTGPSGQDVYVDAQGIEFYRVDDKFYRYTDNAEMQPTSHAKVDRKVVYGGKTYQVKIDRNGVEYFKDDQGKFRDPNHPEREMIQAREGDIDPQTVDNDSPVAVSLKVDGQTVREDVHGVSYYGAYYDTYSKELLTVKDGTFNPNPTEDKIVYEDAKSSTGQTIYMHANGQKYFVKDDKYWDADDETKELTLKSAGDVDPLPNDSNAKANDVQVKELRETFSGKGYPVKLEPTHNVEYYQDEDGRYYTRYGTLLQVQADVFTPSDSDQAITISREIWVDGSGTRFYKNEGHYYKEADDTFMEKLSEGTLDTSEVINMGSFNNTTNVSDVTISKTTMGGKAGKFKVHVKFDNGFEPKYVVYEPASMASFQRVPGTEDTWEFTIEDGQRLTIKEVPFHTTYTISEPVEANGWRLMSIDGEQKTSVSNKVTKKGPADKPYNPAYAHVFHNRFNEVLVSKEVKNGPSLDFDFAVAEITNLEKNAEFSYGLMDEDETFDFYTATADSEGKATVNLTWKLANKKDIVVVVPFEAKIVITETPVADFTTTYKVGDGDEKSVDDKGATELIELAQDKLAVAFTNTAEAKPPTAEPAVSKDGKYDPADQTGATLKSQSGTPKFTPGREIGPDGKPNTFTYTLLDADGNPAETVTVPGEGTYTINKDTGEVTFKPDKGFEGKSPKGIPVRGTDRYGLSADTTYTPIVVPNTETSTLEREVTYTYWDKDGNPVTDATKQTITFTRVGTYNPDKDDHKTEYRDTDPANVIDMPAWTPQDLPAQPAPVDEGGWLPEVDAAPAILGLTPDNAADNGFDDKGQRTDNIPYKPQPPTGAGAQTWGLHGEVQKTDAKGLFTLTTTKTAADDKGKREDNELVEIKLYDPDKGEYVDPGTKVSAYFKGQIVGTYHYDAASGEVVFTPNEGFHDGADPDPAKLLGVDKNGMTADSYYQPHFMPEYQEKTLERTITYVYDDGTPVLDKDGNPITTTQEITFKREVKEVDPVTHEPVWGPWEPESADLPKADSPAADRDGYVPETDVVDPVTGLTEVDCTDEAKAEKYPDITVVYHKPPAAGEKKTFGPRGETQKGTPPFEKGSKDFVDFKLIDPETGEATDKIEVPGQGTYTIDTETGEVTFVPDPNFIGPATKVTVRATDENGSTADGYYTPTVVDNTETVDKVQKISYVYADGSPVLDDEGNPLIVERPGTFTRTGTVDPDTGAITWGSWTPVTLEQVDSPAIEDWTPDKENVPGIEVAEPDKWPGDVVVTYSKPVPPATYWVTYVDPDPSIPPYLEKTYQTKGAPEPPAPADPTKIGYQFKGWERSEDSEGNVTYTAKWEKRDYWVIYIDPATGRVIQEKITEPWGGAEPPAPKDPTREGYDFAGWKRTVDKDGNVTYEATWTPKSSPAPTPTPSPTPSKSTTPASTVSKVAKTLDEAPLARLAIAAAVAGGVALLALRRRHALGDLSAPGRVTTKRSQDAASKHGRHTK